MNIQQEIKLYKSPKKALKVILLCSIFVLPSLYVVITNEDPKLIYWAALLFFGLGYIAGFYQIFDKSVQVIITKDSIYDKTLKIAPIPWGKIVEANLINTSGQEFISLRLEENYNPLSTKSKTAKTIGKLNKMMGFEELNISLGPLKVNSIIMLGLVLEMPTLNTEEREALIQRTLENI
jgi:hypothetical protein